jgi:hypothetical protein|tara:strand:+ start:434 stop:637 length:204 start_codon:yes stop_codon:yes gene_type:complete
MQTTLQVGGTTWYVDEGQLLNWLAANAAQAGAPKTVVREVIDGEQSGRVLLNESQGYSDHLTPNQIG